MPGRLDDPDGMPPDAAAAREAVSAAGRLQVLRLVTDNPGITRAGLIENGMSHGAARQAVQDLQRLGFLRIHRDGIRGPGSTGRYTVDHHALTLGMLALTTWLITADTRTDD